MAHPRKQPDSELQAEQERGSPGHELGKRCRYRANVVGLDQEKVERDFRLIEVLQRELGETSPVSSEVVRGAEVCALMLSDLHAECGESCYAMGYEPGLVFQCWS